MASDSNERETLPPAELELAHVEEFERALRVSENDARLAELERLRPLWGLVDDE